MVVRWYMEYHKDILESRASVEFKFPGINVLSLETKLI